MSLYAKVIGSGVGTSSGSVGVSTIGTIDSQTKSANGAVIVGSLIYFQTADATYPGLVSVGTQTFAGAKTFSGALTLSSTVNKITITAPASGSTLTIQDGFTLTANGNATVSGTNTGDVTISTANGLSLASQALSLALSSGSTTGALSSADWTTFNNKQASGNYITALTGDATASGPGSAALTLATVNASPGSFGSASASLSATVNAKGLITSLSSQSIQIAESQVTNLVSDLAGKQATGNYITALTGDATASGPGSAALTFATVNSNVGSFAISTITVNAKGLVTAASAASTTGSGNVVLATSPTLTTPTIGAASGTSLNLSGLTASSAVATDGSKNLVSVTNTGSGNNVLATSPSLTTPSLGSASAQKITFSGVNVSAPSASTGQVGSDATNGTDGLQLIGSGTTSDVTILNSGGSNVVTIPHASTNLKVGVSNNIVGSDGTANAASGNIGEYVESNVARASAVTLTTTTVVYDVTSISLTAGDWDIMMIAMILGSGTPSWMGAGISATSATVPSTQGYDYVTTGGISLSSEDMTLTIPRYRVRISSTTTYYLIARSGFGSATGLKAYGTISARRVR